jgi:putative pyruvate formate lyase activating enzyme
MELTRRKFIKKSFIFGGALFFGNDSLFALNKKREPGHPSYAKLEAQGKLAQRVEKAYSIFEHCELCPRMCGANRQTGEQGFCRASAKLMVYAANPHFGEEISLVGKRGSGTVFFSNCNLRCVFCQNWPISIQGYRKAVHDAYLADMMIHLQNLGCHNINLVTPTHVMPNILNATRIAFKKGLHLPLVYNTSGYERLEILKLLDGIVDIYLPDMKYMDSDKASKYLSVAPDYPEKAQKAVMEMHRQVGEHRIDNQGIAVHGLMIRHLVMPNNEAGTEKFIRWVAENLPRSTYVNIMHQYYPEHKALEYPEIDRRISVQEFLEAMLWADEYGLTNLDQQSVQIRKIYSKQTLKQPS